MAFFEDRFPDSIAQGASGGPRFSTSEVKTSGGARSANRNWTAPLHFYNVAQAIKTNAQFVLVRSFFWVVYGAFDGFRFKDYSDFKATRLDTSLTAVGGTWQLNKLYSYGSRSVVRKITKPVAGTVVIYDNSGIALSATVDTTTGLATVSGGTPVTWAGEFDVPCKFSSDSLDAKQIGPEAMFMDWGSIDIEEIRL